MELKNKIKKKDDTILIIANGPSVLSFEYGKLINKFQTIGRINNYSTAKYKKFIGDKTHIWFNGANRGLKKRKITNEKVIVLIPHYILRDKYDRIIQRTPKRLKLDPQKFSIVNKEKIKKYERMSRINRPSTGLYAILWSLENYKTVVIHGFNFFKGSNNHYFDSKIKKLINKILFREKYFNDKYHDFTSENSYVNTLIKDKKIITLEKYLK